MTALSPVMSVVIQNDSGMIIPARSVVVAVAVETTSSDGGREPITVTHVDQYGCGKPGNVMVTGNTAIGVGARGLGFYDPFLYVCIDPSVSDPAPGEEWGPSEGSWVLTRNSLTRGFFAQGHSQNGGVPKRSLFLRTYERAPATVCYSSSSSASSQSSGSSASSGSSSHVSGSSSSSGACGCVTVVTGVSCSGGSLSVTYGQARGCC
ncbi:MULTISPECIES: hypothetical protein [unclassified Schlesneria]|uniref:hypothetical protein n=1 Tax=Schlesneria TaxID=656899 RepID=UPI0035A04A61